MCQLTRLVRGAGYDALGLGIELAFAWYFLSQLRLLQVIALCLHGCLSFLFSIFHLSFLFFNCGFCSDFDIYPATLYSSLHMPECEGSHLYSDLHYIIPRRCIISIIVHMVFGRHRNY